MTLIKGEYFSLMFFYPDKFMNGEVWRFFTQPFAHISLYHLIIDSITFIALYLCFEGSRLSFIFIVLLSAASSIVFSVLFSDVVYQTGIGGLSGVIHGVAVAYAVQLIYRKKDRAVGFILLLAIIFKCIYELTVNDVLFKNLHFGDVGVSIVQAHAGGAVGGLVAALILILFIHKSD